MGQTLDIVMATGNPHKVEELSAIFADLGLEEVRLLSLKDAAPERSLEEPKETGTTFEANATIKAESYAAQTGMLCLADDSGIEIDALGGKPGVISSHYCTDGEEKGMSRAERDAANNARVMREMEGVPVEGRSARFVCVMALAAPATQASGMGFQPVSTRPTSRQPVALDKLSTHARYLPHWQHGGATYFITFRVMQGRLSPSEQQIVFDACKHWDGKRMDVLAFVIMPDHVHMIMRPRLEVADALHSLPSLIGSIKQFSAMQINRARAQHGQLWEQEYFDRIIRPDEWADTWNYIVLNPVRSGLVTGEELYPFLYVNRALYREVPAEVFRSEQAFRAEQKAVEEGRDGLEAHTTRSGSSESNLLTIVRGTFEGRIGLQPEVPRGENGFGYDPLFLVAPEFAFTGAEMEAVEKNRRSHRAMAARLMVVEIRRLMTATK